jgi:hypothetical protein
MRTRLQDEHLVSGGTLQPRYRRILAFGDVLDEGIGLFRQHWAHFALVSAVALIPPGLFGVWFAAAGPVRNPITLAQLRSGRLVPAAAPDTQIGTLIATFAVSVLFYCVWTAAVSATTESYLRGGEARLEHVYRRALGRFFAVLLGTLLYALGLSVVSMVALALVFVTGFGGLGGLVPAVALLVWWLKPGVRNTGWLKWLIIVCAPFGLLLYFGTRWSMYIAAAVLERRGPLASLRRSSELSDRHVLRVLAILGVTSTIVSVLVYAPTALISIPLMISSGIVDNGTSTERIMSAAATIVLRVVFQSVAAVVYTLMFVDLRNRREGTDLAERLMQLETVPVTPGG